MQKLAIRLPHSREETLAIKTTDDKFCIPIIVPHSIFSKSVVIWSLERRYLVSPGLLRIFIKVA
jgi:hypothetical protein